MNKIFLVLSFCLFSACAKTVEPNRILCDQSDPVSCGKTLKETCTKGGEILSVNSVVEIVFVCNK